MQQKRLVLASGSPYRRELLSRLRVPFEWHAPDVDEGVRGGEAPQARAERLAVAKARALQSRFPDACLIGSDQVAVCAGALLGKPGSAEAARRQLSRSAGKPVEFFTAACVIDCGEPAQSHVDRTVVHLRALAPAEIDAYIRLEKAFDCAAGFKAESLGIALFERVESSDPTALIGLPLIWLSNALARAGIDVLAGSSAQAG